MKLPLFLAFLATAATALAVPDTQAKVSAAEAAELGGPRLTCSGADKAGSADGVAEYTGKYQGSWPGMKGTYGFEPGPYAAEKPLFSITAQNKAQYADKLTDGEKALFARYPQTYRMDVYPSHRDFAAPQAVCDNTRKNAETSEIVHDGKGVTGTGFGFLFPIPKSGLEAIWTIANAGKVWTESCICDIADVYAGGNVAWGREKFMVLTLASSPKNGFSYQDRLNSYFYDGFLLPEREKGFVAVGYQPNDYTSEGTMSWQYLPGTRRVRQAPEIGFDYPVPPAGFRTVDDDYGFNGSPERYTWKIVGKKEYYVPYDNFRVNDPAVKYKDLVKDGTVNPDYVRYELHRVWVVEGTLRPGVRHIYAKRVVYADEDSWLSVLADNYDNHGQLWRVSLITYHYSQESGTWHRGASVYHDLSAGTYEAGYLTNESAQWWRINQPLSPNQFSPTAAAQGGH
ncbi:MAG: DUF1329 domain-containing protein [Nevskia sp.]|nr:DUF1329 domain-containing protein [Nevskia sp.]